MSAALSTKANRLAGFAEAGLFLLLAVLTWDRLGDLLIDFPHELYNAWLIADVRRLPYRDFAYIYGPLPLTWNAIVLRLLGTHNHSIQISNLVIAAFACLSLWTVFSYAWSKAVAHCATAAFQLLAIFPALPLCTNFNFVAPYSHAVTVGMTLSLGALAFFAKGLFALHDRRAAYWWLASFACASTTILTKPEIALACWLALAAGHTAHLWSTPQPQRCNQMWSVLAQVCLALLVIGGIAVALAALFYSPQEIPHVLGAAFAAISPSALSGIRQKAQLGADAPLMNGLRVLLWGSCGICFLGLVLLWGRLVAREAPSPRKVLVLGILSFLPLPAFVLSAPALAYKVLIESLPRGMPVWGLLALCVVVFDLCQGRRQCLDSPQAVKAQLQNVLALAFGVFAAGLLSRMLLNPRLNEYGFYQAVPTLLFCTAVAGSVIRRWFVHNKRGAWISGTAFAGLLAAFLATHVAKSASTLMQKTYLVDSATLRLFTLPPPRHPNAAAILAASRDLKQRLRSGETVAALPGGSIIHYLIQQPNPVRFHQLGPYEMQAYGEDAILSAYAKTQPTYVVLVHRPHFGYPPLLSARFFSWLRSNYMSLALYGKTPFTSEESYGVEIWKRSTP